MSIDHVFTRNAIQIIVGYISHGQNKFYDANKILVSFTKQTILPTWAWKKGY